MNQQTKPAKVHKAARVHSCTAPPTSEAQRRAAVMLEVLAGLRSAPQAAAALKISVNHYYLLERQALQGLVAACEPRPTGQRVDPQRQLRALEQALERSRRECQRQAALVRATQRAVGLPATPPPEHAAGKPRRGKNRKSAPRRRTTAIRALRMAHRLSQESLAQDEAAAVQPIAGGGDSPLSFQQEHGDDARGM